MAEKRLDVVVAAKALGIEATDRQLKSLARTLREAQGGAGGRGFFGGLQAGLGRGSNFKESLELLAGGGAIAGLGLAGRMLNDAAKKAEEIALNGKTGTGEMVEELAKAIPIYGDIIAAGRTFRGLIDGTTISTAKLNAENAKTNELIEIRAKLMKGEGLVESQATEQDLQRQLARARMRLAGKDTPTGNQVGDELLPFARRIAKAFGFSDAATDVARLESELARLRKAQANAREIERKEFGADLLGQRSDILKQIPGKQLEAERDAIREKFAREEIALGKRLRDPALEGPQKQLLKQMLELLPSVRDEALRNLANQPAPPNRTQFQNSPFLTGAGDAASRKQDQMLQKFDALLKLANLIASYLRPAASAGGGPQLGGSN